MAKYIYPAIFAKEEGAYSISFPDIEGCYTCSESIQEGMDMAKDALALMLYDMEQEKVYIPKASDIKDIKCNDNEFITYIAADTSFYERYYSNRTVKKNCTLPYWLEREASEKNINFSQVLQEALQEKLQEVR